MYASRLINCWLKSAVIRIFLRKSMRSSHLQTLGKKRDAKHVSRPGVFKVGSIVVFVKCIIMNVGTARCHITAGTSSGPPTNDQGLFRPATGDRKRLTRSQSLAHPPCCCHHRDGGQAASNRFSYNFARRCPCAAASSSSSPASRSSTAMTTRSFPAARMNVLNSRMLDDGLSSSSEDDALFMSRTRLKAFLADGPYFSGSLSSLVSPVRDLKTC